MCLQGMVDELIMKDEGRKIMRVMEYLLLSVISVTISVSFLVDSALSSNNNK